MAKYGHKTTPPNEEAIAQIVIVMTPNGEYTTGFQIEPGNEEKVALLLLTMVNTKMYAHLFKQLLANQPDEAKKVAKCITGMIKENSDGPIISPTNFGKRMANNGDEND